MGKKQDAKEASFSSKSVDEKLDQLYQTIRSENGDNKKWRDEMRSEMKSITHKVNTLEKRIHRMESNNQHAQGEIAALHNNVHELQQNALALDIIIKGLPEIEQDDTQLAELVAAVFTTLGCRPLLSQVNTATRLGKRNDNNNANTTKYRAVLLQMKTNDGKKQLMDAKRKKELQCSEVMFNNQPIGDAAKKIYFDERLSKYMSDLHYEARQLKQKKLCHSVWIRGGSLFIRKKQSSEPKKITNLEQLRMLSKRSRKSTPVNDDDESDEYLSGSSEDTASDDDDEEPDAKRGKGNGVKTRSGGKGK